MSQQKTVREMIAQGELSMGDLVAIHNLIADAPATSKTFSQRSKAADRILKVAEAKAVNLDLVYRDGDEGAWQLAAPAVEPEEPAKPADKPDDKADRQQQQQQQQPQDPAPPKQEPKPRARGKAAKAEKKGPSIRSVAEGLLMEVVARDEDKRPIGLAYEEILAQLREQFPGANTSVACLRWYAVHMRERGTMPPSRPRAVPQAKEAEGKGIAQKIAEQQAEAVAA